MFGQCTVGVLCIFNVIHSLWRIGLHGGEFNGCVGVSALILQLAFVVFLEFMSELD